ncbi:MAG: polymerase sigma factor, sigma-70 family [Planctomycetota bacterium]|nr:polymerase sigma factor, sigma-70 family [Planctomycetota bacterium]
MAIGRRGDVLRQFRTLFQVGAISGLSDAELLERSVSRQGASSELAFAALVERHGPMVLRVCKKALGDPHDAHDAFQSTFLVLARKAESIRDTRSVASWLHGVALRVSATSRADSVRRRKHERRKAEGAGFALALKEPDDVAAVLHEEVGRLPGRYRAAVVLCYLEGKSYEEAAGHLQCPVGTVKSRLAWARDRLRDRLTRRGLAPAAGAIATILAAESASAAVPLPAIWVETTTEAAIAFAAPSFATIAAGTVPASAAALAKGVMHAMFMNKIKLAAMTGAVVLGATGLGVLAQDPTPAVTPAPAPAQAAPDAAEVDRLKVMEQKLDRLIQALEASRPATSPTPAARLGDPFHPVRPEGGPALGLPVVRTTPAPGTTPTAFDGPTLTPPPRNALTVDRLNQLEQRLSRLEQRIERLEKRVPASEEEPASKARTAR